MAETNLFGMTEPPYSLEAEQSVLGSVLLDPHCISTVLGHIKADCFYREQNRAIFEAFSVMFANNTPIDAVTTLNAVKNSKAFPSAEDAKVYIVSLMQAVPSSASVEHYCKIVEDKYLKRTLISIAEDIISEARDDSANADLLLDSAEQRIFDVRQGKNVAGMVSLKEAIYEAYDNLEKLTGPDKEKYEGMRSGFPKLDEVTTGFGKSNLIVLAARPAMGKTSFALNIATNIARKYPDKAVAVFSLEMSSDELAMRILASESLVDSERMKKGALTTDDWSKLFQSAQYLSGMNNILIDDTSASTVLQMKAKLRRIKNLGFVVIDYLQLMSGGNSNRNRVEEVSMMTRGLKIMAKELNVPVLILSQLNRGSEHRTEHKPTIADLRESGSIEQDADAVLFLYRDIVYNPQANPSSAECIVAKNRHGRTGTIELRWDGSHTRFFNTEIYREDEADKKPKFEIEEDNEPEYEPEFDNDFASEDEQTDTSF